MELKWIPGPCHSPSLIPLAPPPPRLLSWKDALQWVPPWSLELRAAPLPGFQGTWALLSVSRSVLGDFVLNLRWDENPTELSKGVFQPGRGNLPGVEMLERQHRRGILASIHVFIFQPAIFFFFLTEGLSSPRILRVPLPHP